MKIIGLDPAKYYQFYILASDHSYSNVSIQNRFEIQNVFSEWKSTRNNGGAGGGTGLSNTFLHKIFNRRPDTSGSLYITGHTNTTNAGILNAMVIEESNQAKQ